MTTCCDQAGGVPVDAGLFSSATVAEIEQRFARLAPHERPVLWQHVTQPEYRALRGWLDEQLAELGEPIARIFVSRLRDPDRYTQALAELACGYALRVPGYSTEFGACMSGLTPDVVVTGPDARRMVVEVWRRGLPAATARRNARWTQLARCIRRIQVPAAVAAGSAARTVVEPPGESARKRIERGLRRWLGDNGAPATPSIEIEGLTFRVVGTTTSGCAELLPIRASAATDRNDIVRTIERKVSRYRRLVEELDLPLLVVLSADPETALDAALVANVLAGNNITNITIPAYGVGTFNSGRVALRQSNAPPAFDSALSGVAWLEINDGVHAELNPLWLNPVAQRPIQHRSRPDEPSDGRPGGEVSGT